MINNMEKSGKNVKLTLLGCRTCISGGAAISFKATADANLFAYLEGKSCLRTYSKVHETATLLAVLRNARYKLMARFSDAIHMGTIHYAINYINGEACIGIISKPNLNGTIRAVKRALMGLTPASLYPAYVDALKGLETVDDRGKRGIVKPDREYYDHCASALCKSITAGINVVLCGKLGKETDKTSASLDSFLGAVDGLDWISPPGGGTKPVDPVGIRVSDEKEQVISIPNGCAGAMAKNYVEYALKCQVCQVDSKLYTHRPAGKVSSLTDSDKINKYIDNMAKYANKDGQQYCYAYIIGTKAYASARAIASDSKSSIDKLLADIKKLSA